MDTPTAYPLAWPHGKARTAWNARVVGKFTANGKLITRTAAMRRLEAELGRLGGGYGIISSDLVLRSDGQPHLGKGEPADPGICLYFRMAGKPYAMACDTYTTLAQNMAAIANHIAATRAITRYGVASAAETLQAFRALPAPKKAHEILGVTPSARPEEVKAAWRALIAEHHPDAGGSEQRAAELNAARDEMLRATS